MTRYLLLLAFACTFWSCEKDSLRVAFEMTYPENRFTVPAGLNTLESHYLFFRDIPTNKAFFFGETEESEIIEINPASAVLRADQRISDFSFAEEIVIRLCEDNQANINNVLQKCRREIFFRENIPFNTGRQVELLPNGNNLQPTLTGDNFNFVLVFRRNRAFTSAPIPANLVMNFEARR
ncbi:MAG: hypothetical protein AAGI23_12460 [Bacteroidota bacterium]